MLSYQGCSLEQPLANNPCAHTVGRLFSSRCLRFQRMCGEIHAPTHVKEARTKNNLSGSAPARYGRMGCSSV